MTTIERGDVRPIDILPPYNPEAEAAVLGSCLLDAEAIHTLRGDLAATDFYRSKNAAIYAAMVHLAGQGVPVDFTTLTDELTRRGEYEEVGGYSYLVDLVGVVPTAVHAPYYAAIVRRTAVKRSLISAAGKIAAVAYDETLEAEDAMSRANELLAAVQRGMGSGDTYSPEQQADILMGMVERLEMGTPPGIPTGFVRLDWLTGGLRPGGLYVIGAPTGVGKTAWLGSTALNVSHRSRGARRQLFATCEVTTPEMVKRFAAAYAGRDWNEIERALTEKGDRGEITGALRDAAERIASSGITLYHKGRLTVDMIRSRATRMLSGGGLDVLYVDYLQRLTAEGKRSDNREREVSGMVQGLKSLAVDLAIPVVVAAQFSRACQYRPNKEPLLSDYRESGGIENEADVALGLYRPYKWDQSKPPHEAYLYVMKNRHGEEDCREELVWMPETTRYGSAHRGGNDG
jgi:replicative DNA helicase